MEHIEYRFDSEGRVVSKICTPATPPQTLTRKQVEYPGWIDMVMRVRWGVLAAGLVFPWVFGMDSWQGWVPWLGICAIFAATPHIAYRVYLQKDKDTAEIVFNNEDDGYCYLDEDADGRY